MIHVVTPFPMLLDFAFYAPLLLRLALGVYALAIGFSTNHKELTPLGIAHRALFIVSGISLIVGFGVQICAIIMAILLIVSIVDKKARLTIEISRVEMSLLLVIALSLLVSGAGPLAIDLPL